MKRVLLLIVLAAAYVAIIPAFAGYMRDRPFVEKLGYLPEPAFLRAVTADHKQLTAAWLIWETLFYYGGVVRPNEKVDTSRLDYQSTEKFIWATIHLDPYNMDAYYFGQATLVWDIGRVREANALIEYGMQFRDWDFYLPMFAGFNYAHFLKDYEKAAYHYRRAGELSGAELFVKLASRYLHQVGQTDLAIAYLDMMVKGARNEAIRKPLQLRLEAFRQMRLVERARDAFREDRGRLPRSVEELLSTGHLAAKPIDPYGGEFQIDGDGRVVLTSVFAPKPLAKKATKPNGRP